MNNTFLYFHKILKRPEENLSFGPDISNAISEDQFVHLLRSLDGRLVDWENLIVAELRGRPKLRNAVALTFDDGYRDFIDVVLPIIEQFGVKVLLFITPQFASGNVLPYEYLVADLIRRCPRLKIPEHGFPNIPMSVDNSTRYNLIRLAMKEKYSEERQTTLTRLLEANGLNVGQLSVPEMLNWNDLRELDQHPLIEIGAHTMSHPVLSKIATNSAWKEIGESKRIIEEQLKNRVSCFAYPYGSNSFTNRLMVRLSGFKYGFATENGKGGAMAIPRSNSVNCSTNLGLNTQFRNQTTGKIASPL